jgi:hypothetical protein
MKPARLAQLSIAAAILYQVLLVVLIWLRPDLPPYSTTISEWAIGRYGVLMQFAFLCSALCYLCLFLALVKNMKGRWSVVGLSLLFISFMGTIGVGVFITDPYPPDFTLTTTVIHTVSGGLGMLFLPIAALIINLNLPRQNEAWALYKRQLYILAVMPIIAFVGFIIHLNIYIIPLGENAIGPDVPIGYPPRIMFLAYHIWAIGTALIFIKKENLIISSL